MGRASLVVGFGLTFSFASVGCLLTTHLDGLADESAEGPADRADADAGAETSDAPSDVRDAEVTGDGDARAKTAVLVQSAVRSTPADKLLAVPLPKPTTAGNTLVVAVTGVVLPSGNTLASVVDDAPGGSDAIVATQPVIAQSKCGNTAQVLYAKLIRGGARIVQINVTLQTSLEAWVLEVAGLDTNAPFAEASSTEGVNPTVIAPLVSTRAGGLALSVVADCGDVGTLAATSAFTALQVQNGNGAAYLLPPAGGSYGAAFTGVGNAAWVATTASFE